MKAFLVSILLFSMLYSSTTINISSGVMKYYKDLKKDFIWYEGNKLNPLALELINIIKNDPVLKPIANDKFKLEFILSKISETNNSIETKKRVDTLLTSIFDKYINSLLKGSINWNKFEQHLLKIKEEKNIEANWSKYQVKKSSVKLLQEFLEANSFDEIKKKSDFNFFYGKKLEKKLLELEKIKKEGGFVKVETSAALKLNDNKESVKLLKTRLFQSGDYKKNNFDTLFDKNLYGAIVDFQKRHGLITDGVVGKNTLDKLNIPVDEKIKKIRLNIERVRWMPRKLGQEYLLVNIPEYKLKLFKGEKTELQMDVIVGKQKFPTPIFSHKLSQIVLNPYWKIPQTIVKNEIIPKLVKDSSYLEKENIAVYENWKTSSLEFDVSNVDWSMYLNNDLIGTPKDAPMRFIQKPGGTNPLGKVKFLFPNKYTVYLHDTPERKYFNLKDKTLSHGCIRVEKPIKLYDYIVSNNKDIEKSKNLNEKKIKLNKKLPIHIVYLTSWVDENNILHFRDDIYNYDKIQKELLFKSQM